MSHRNEKEILAFVQGKGLQFFGPDCCNGWVDFEPTEQDAAAQDLLSGQGAYEFRLKPRTVKIGSREVEAPVLDPQIGQELWYWDQGLWEPVKAEGDQALKSCDFTEAGLFFASPEACRAAREAVTALMRGES